MLFLFYLFIYFLFLFMDNYNDQILHYNNLARHCVGNFRCPGCRTGDWGWVKVPIGLPRFKKPTTDFMEKMIKGGNCQLVICLWLKVIDSIGHSSN